jgi:serine/threonine protein kinase HipA of HipAB toxin-antitoxin module
MGLTALRVRAAKADDGRNETEPFRQDSTGFEETSVMKKKHTGTQIVAKLRQADVLIGQGKTVPEVCKEIEVSEQTYYRWRQKYRGMSPEMVKELRALQKENARLRKVVADQAIENAILKEAASKN